MFFLFDRRQWWVRPSTHTFVYERDPDFDRFRRDPSGRVETYVRIWLADWDGPSPLLRSYVGGVRIRPGGPERKDYRRVTRNVVRAVGPERGQRLCRRLPRHLRRFRGNRETVSS